MAYVAHEHDTNAGTNAILGVLLVVVALILGFIIFRNGLGAAPEAPGGSINIQTPGILENNGAATPDLRENNGESGSIGTDQMPQQQ